MNYLTGKLEPSCYEIMLQLCRCFCVSFFLKVALVLQANEAGDKGSAVLKKELEMTKSELEAAKSGARGLGDGMVWLCFRQMTALVFAVISRIIFLFQN